MMKPKEDFQKLRERMIVRDILSRGITDEAVLKAMSEVERHRFVPENLADQAYEDYPLPIGYGQSISQPYIVALMTELLEIKPDHRILEIGTGSGYQTAILASIAKEVFTIERIEPLYEGAKELLGQLGFENVFFTCGDGYEGRQLFAPYDGIIVTAGTTKVPSAYIEQLKEGGKLVIPVGNTIHEELMLISKNSDGTVSEKAVLPVRFVKLVH